jgi:plasmid stability protein
MPTITIKNVPESLLKRLRAYAEADARSLNRELIYLLEEALLNRESAEGEESMEALARRQAAAWRALGGTWESELVPEEEGRAIMDSRTLGRDID